MSARQFAALSLVAAALLATSRPAEAASPLNEIKAQAAKVEQAALRFSQELNAIKNEREFKALQIGAGFIQVFADEIQKLAVSNNNLGQIRNIVAAMERGLPNIEANVKRLQDRLGNDRTRKLRRAFDDLEDEIEELADDVN